MTPPALQIDELEVRHRAVHAVRGVSVDVARGEIVGLIGPNGAGKSSTLHAVMGLVPVASGDVRLHGRSLAGRRPEDISRAGLALVPEGRRIFSELTVEENLRLGLAGRGGRQSRNDELAGVYELFPVLARYRRSQAGGLSGGEQQQLAIGRALVAQPDVLLLDEPSLGLAPMVVDIVFEVLDRIRAEGIAILLVEQRAQRTVALADRSHVLSNGRVRLTIGPENATDTEALVSAYLA